VHESAFKRISGGRVAYGPIGVPLDCDLVSMKDGTIFRGGCEAKNANGQTKIVAAKSNSDPTGHHLKDGDKYLKDYLNSDDGKYLKDHLESDKAQLRATRMEAVWNIVWWRRIIYFLTVLFSLFLVALPWLADWLSTREFMPTTDLKLIARYVEPILMAAGYLVPDWVEKTWLGTFSKEPVWFLIGLVGVIATMLIGWLLEKKIHSHASDIWHYKPNSKIPKWAENPKSTFLYKLRSRHGVIWTYRQYRLNAAPIILLLVLAAIIGWLLEKYWGEYSDYITIYAILVVIVVVVRWAWHKHKLGGQGPAA
jgi:hypothetical protein